MVNPELSTEERILEAAREVFPRRGFDGTRMQEIADEAGINKALLHYYYRNKENLFMAVFREAFSKMIARTLDIFRSAEPFERKLEQFYDYHISFLKENSYVPWFILNALYEKPSEIAMLFSEYRFMPEEVLAGLEQQLKAEGYEVENILQLYVNILALSVFPFVARPLLVQVLRLSDDQLETFYLDRKKLLPQFILHAIKPSESSK